MNQYATWLEDQMKFNFKVKSLISSSDELIHTEDITDQDLQLG